MENRLDHLEDDEVTKITKRALSLAGEVIRNEFESPKIIALRGKHDVQVSADIKSEKLITDYLQKHFPAHSFFTEENDFHFINHDNLWVVDPLDGTNNFVLRIPYFGISVAFFHDGA